MEANQVGQDLESQKVARYIQLLNKMEKSGLDDSEFTEFRLLEEYMKTGKTAPPPTPKTKTPQPVGSGSLARDMWGAELGLTPDQMEQGTDVVGDTVKGMGRDLGENFRLTNEMYLKPWWRSVSKDPSSAISGLGESALEVGTGIPATLLGLVGQGSATLPRIAAGQNVWDAISDTTSVRESIAGPLTYKPINPDVSNVYTQTALSPLTTFEELVGMGVDYANPPKEDETPEQASTRQQRNESRKLVFTLAGLALLGGVAKGSGIKKSIKDYSKSVDSWYEKLRQRPPRWMGPEEATPITPPVGALEEIPKGVMSSAEQGAIYGEGGAVLMSDQMKAKGLPAAEGAAVMGERNTIPPTATTKQPILDTMEMNIKRMVPKLYEAMRNFRFERDGKSGGMLQELVEIDKMMAIAMQPVLEGLDAKAVDRTIHKRLADIIEGRVWGPVNRLEEMAVAKYKAMMDSITQEIYTLKEQGYEFKIAGPWGTREWHPIEGYYPRYYENLAEVLESDTKIGGKRAGDILKERLAQRFYPDEFNSADLAKRQHAIDKAQTLVAEYAGKQSPKKYGNLEGSRLWSPEDVADLEEAGILKRTYGSDVIADYIEKSQERLAWVRNFGNDVETHGMGHKIPELWLEAMTALEKEGNTVGRSYVDEALRRYVGKWKPNRWIKFSKYLNLLSTPKMIMSTASNMNQWIANTWPLMHLENIPGALFDNIKLLMGDPSMEEFYRRSGISVTPDKIIQKVGDDPGIATTAQRLFYNMIGFSQSEGWDAGFAGNAARREMFTLSRKLALHPEAPERSISGLLQAARQGKLPAWRAGAWEQRLRELGANSLDISRIKSGQVLGPENAETLMRAAWELKMLSQFTGDVWGKMKWQSNPNLAIIAKFKNFPISQALTFGYRGVLDPAIRFLRTAGQEGDITPLLKTPFTLGIAGALTTAVKDKVWGLLGRPEMYDEYMKNKEWYDQWLFFITQAGSLGIASDLVAASSNEKLMTNVLGPTLSDGYKFIGTLIKWREQVNASFNAKSAQLFLDRAGRIAEVTAKDFADMQPMAKMVLTAFWRDYRDDRLFTDWERKYNLLLKTYKDMYFYNPGAAEEYWAGAMGTWGVEYEIVTGRKPNKPTPQEVIDYNLQQQGIKVKVK